MKVTINALQYKHKSSGIGVMIRDLFGAYTFFSSESCRVVVPKDAPLFPCSEITELIHCPWDHRQNLKRMFFQTFRLGRMCRDSVLLTTDSKIPFFLPRSCVLIPLITDLAVFRMPEVYQASRVLWWKLQYRYLRRRADLILAISEFTKKEIIDVLDVPEDKVRVVHCACSPELHRVEDTGALREKYGLNAPFILFVGNTNPRKNLERLMRAFDRMKSVVTLPHRLVIAGDFGWKFDREKALEGLKHSEDIRFIGFVPDEEMPSLYSAAELFAFPTLYEGFGIPVLEAQSCGVPVLTSDVSSLPEVGGDAAFYVDPYDEQSMADGMLKVLTDGELRQGLIQKGYENVKRFSWIKSAQRLHEIIKTEVEI